MAHDVFISYSRRDTELCDLLANRLSAAGVSCWVDREGIDGGIAWAKTIGGAIHEAQVILFVATEHSLASEQVYKEIDLAATKNKKIIPIEVDPFPPTYPLEYHIHSLQRMMLGRKPDVAQIDSIANAIAKAVGRSVPTPPQASRAPAPISPGQSNVWGDMDASSSGTEEQRPPGSPDTARSTKKRFDHPDGSVVFLEHRQKWVAYAEGRIVCTQASSDSALRFLKERFGITGAIVGEGPTVADDSDPTVTNLMDNMSEAASRLWDLVFLAATSRLGRIECSSTESYFTAHTAGEGRQTRTDWCVWPKTDHLLTEIRVPSSPDWDRRIDAHLGLERLEYNTKNGGRYKLRIRSGADDQAIACIVDLVADTFSRKGVDLPKVAPAPTVANSETRPLGTCPTCNLLNDSSARFCVECGTRLT